jgi:hypothetical protein
METMDLSGTVSIIVQEYQTHPGIFFENHLYGCLSLLESRLDSSGALDGSHVLIGSQNGFYKNPVCLFEGSAAYQSVWAQLFQNDVSAGFVDNLEDALIEALEGSVFFSYAVEHGDLSAELEARATALMPKAKRRLAKSRKGVQVGTPPKSKLRFDKTRRRSITH